MTDAIDLSILVPCYNEEGNLPEFVERAVRTLEGLGIQWEVVMVDDGSHDRTWEVIEHLCLQEPRLLGVRHETNQGMVAGWRSALEHSRGSHVCVIDADLQYQPEDIARLWRELLFRNVDIVQGCRNSLTRVRDRRYHLSRGLNVMLNRLLGMNAKDNKSGFFVTRRTVFRHILQHRRKYKYFQTFIMVSAYKKGYSIAEVDTIFEERTLGTSFVPKMPIKVVLNTFVDLARALFEFRTATDFDHDLSNFLENNPPLREPEPLSPTRNLWQRVYFATMPLHHWMISEASRDYYNDLNRSQYLSPEQVRRYQELKLRKLVEHAYYNVFHYREAMRRAGVTPQDIRGLDDLTLLPTLSKDECRAELYGGMIANRYDPNRVLKITTSGSTGEPFTCYADRRQLEFRFAATLRSLEWANYRFGDRQLRLWHQTIGMSRAQAFKEWLDAKFVRRKFIPVFEMRESNLEELIRTIRRFQPVLIDGYAEAFNLLASYIKDRKISGIKVNGLMSSAQSLPEESRRIIEEAFQCEVFDKYGSREFSGIAYECPAHSGHHVVAENYIVEVLADNRPAQPGEMGEVLVTDLNNTTMPLIRYRIGDLAVALDNSELCACGRGLPLIGRIEGRVQSIVVGTARQFVPGTFFAHVLKDFDKTIRTYQIVQEKFGEIKFYVIKGSRYTDGSFAEILALLRKHLGQDLVIHTEFVDSIAMVRTGKHMAVVSKLNLDFQLGSYQPEPDSARLAN